MFLMKCSKKSDRFASSKSRKSLHTDFNALFIFSISEGGGSIYFSAYFSSPISLFWYSWVSKYSVLLFLHPCLFCSDVPFFFLPFFFFLLSMAFLNFSSCL